MTLKKIEARLRREPELDKLEANVVKALTRAVMRFVQAGEAASWGGPLEDKMEEKFIVVWTIDGETTSTPHSTQDAALHQAEKLLRAWL